MVTPGRSIAKGDKEDYVAAVREFVEGVPSRCNTGTGTGVGTTYVNNQIDSTTTLTSVTPIRTNLIVASRKKEIPIRVLDRVNDIVYYIDIQEGTEKVPEKGTVACASEDRKDDPKDNVSFVYIKLQALDSEDFVRMENTMKYSVKDKADTIFPKLLPGMFIIEK